MTDMTDMTASAASQFDETGPPDPPETERLSKLSGENARLRSEIRQAVARAKRAEADATRVRASTKFLVGDLLVQAARRPRRLLLLPRDLIRLYRLRGHRRTQAATAIEEGGAGRARRSDYSDEIAARLLLPRVGAQPRMPLAIAGALDPLTSAQWRGIAAVTDVLPHDAAMLIRDVDPDVVVIDTASSGPFGTWAHLGDPAATDRALAARDLITAAKGLGRPVMLLRSRHDSAGFDTIGASCDIVVDLPGSTTGKPWQSGIDLGVVARIAPELLLAGAAPTASGDPRPGILIADGLDPFSDRVTLPTDPHRDHHRDHPLAAAWAEQAANRQLPLLAIDPTAPPVPAVEAAVRDCAVVALTHDHPAGIVGGSLLALLSLAAGRRLVAPDDEDLRSILGVSDPTAAENLGWFAYRTGDAGSARRALDHAIAARPTDLRMRWSLWRSLFARASAATAWHDAITRLGLGVEPRSHRSVAFFSTELDSTVLDINAIVEFVTTEDTLIHEIVCDHSQVERISGALMAAGTSTPVIGITVRGEPVPDRARAAQACRSHLLCEMETSSLSPNEILDAVLGYELAGSPGQMLLRSVTGTWSVRITDRDSALAGSTPDPVSVDHPGGAV